VTGVLNKCEWLFKVLDEVMFLFQTGSYHKSPPNVSAMATVVTMVKVVQL
jgi:hypothetical protein